MLTPANLKFEFELFLQRRRRVRCRGLRLTLPPLPSSVKTMEKHILGRELLLREWRSPMITIRCRVQPCRSPSAAPIGDGLAADRSYLSANVVVSDSSTNSLADGIRYLRGGSLERARLCFEEASRSREPQIRTEALRRLADVKRRRAEWDEAMALAQRAASIAAEHGRRAGDGGQLRWVVGLAAAVDLALRHGSDDNISVAVVQFEGVSAPPQPERSVRAGRSQSATPPVMRTSSTAGGSAAARQVSTRPHLASPTRPTTYTRPNAASVSLPKRSVTRRWLGALLNDNVLFGLSTGILLLWLALQLMPG